MSIASKMAKIIGLDDYNKTWHPEIYIEQTMLVVKKLLNDNLTVVLDLQISLNKSTAQFADLGYVIIVGEKIEAETPQMAICLAAASFYNLEEEVNGLKTI